ncbi:peroxide stress protein YaaA [Lacinutrix sp. Hel_I_90]|uniref:peroxide stress protein YaaA n=1 Tax=Lacinutrix sp. Hel_I_90 TaxID=1249999 RepID=UPI0005CA3B28|nr:peroxide stress protein YaaA [Lacinutrix sp. Hel_I_90]
MKLVLSPAKSLNFESKLPTTKISESEFLEQSEKLNKVLKKKSVKGLSELMHISESLGQLNYERNQDWKLPFTKDNARPAIYAFNGDVYRGLDAYTIPTQQIEKLQDTVRILSGLYGVLKPLDLIQAYRLEMGTKLPVGTKKNLYEFWKKDIVKSLNNELKDDEVFVNLASNEYFKAVDTKALKVPVVTVDFKEYKDGKYKIVAIYAKVARGLMARYIVDTNAKTIDDLKGFRKEGYGFSDELSSENNLVFTR